MTNSSGGRLMRSSLNLHDGADTSEDEKVAEQILRTSLAGENFGGTQGTDFHREGHKRSR